MIATYIDRNGKSYELPKKTLKICKMIDEAYAGVTSEDSYRKQYAFVCETLGKEDASLLLDGKSINDIALDDLTIVFKGIEQAYLKNVNEFNMQMEVESLNHPTIDKLIEVGKSVGNINGMMANQK